MVHKHSKEFINELEKDLARAREEIRLHGARTIADLPKRITREFTHKEREALLKELTPKRTRELWKKYGLEADQVKQHTMEPISNVREDSIEEEMRQLREHFKKNEGILVRELTPEERDQLVDELTTERSEELFREFGLNTMRYIDENGNVREP